MTDRDQEPDLEAISLSDSNSNAITEVRRPNRWVRPMAIVAAATLTLGFLGFESTQGGSSRSSKAKTKSDQPTPSPSNIKSANLFSPEAPLDDHNISCDITTSTTPDGQEVLFAKDPKNFTDAKHPVLTPLNQDLKVNNMFRGIVDFTPYVADSGGPYSIDLLEVHTDGTRLALRATAEINNGDNLYHPKPIRYYTLSNQSITEGHVGNMDYSIYRQHGAAVLSAWCDDTFIGRSNRYEESIYTFNNTTTTTSAPPTLAETR